MRTNVQHSKFTFSKITCRRKKIDLCLIHIIHNNKYYNKVKQTACLKQNNIIIYNKNKTKY